MIPPTPVGASKLAAVVDALHWGAEYKASATMSNQPRRPTFRQWCFNQVAACLQKYDEDIVHDWQPTNRERISARNVMSGISVRPYRAITSAFSGETQDAAVPFLYMLTTSSAANRSDRRHGRPTVAGGEPPRAGRPGRRHPGRPDGQPVARGHGRKEGSMREWVRWVLFAGAMTAIVLSIFFIDPVRTEWVELDRATVGTVYIRTADVSAILGPGELELDDSGGVRHNVNTQVVVGALRINVRGTADQVHRLVRGE